MHEFLERWRSGDRVLLIDGGCGAELPSRGVPHAPPIWSAAGVHRAPGIVREIHRTHVEAGAQVVTALTFRTHRRALERVGLVGCSLRLTCAAVRLAREAVSAAAPDHTVLVAGSLSPLEDCFRADLVPDLEEARAEHRERANELSFAGVDLVLAETFNCREEAEIAMAAATEAGLPVMVSFTLRRDGALPSGESLRSCARAILAWGPLAIGVNCCLPSVAGTAIAVLLEECGASGVPVGAYPNAGASLGRQGWAFSHSASPATLAESAMPWIDAGARWVGGCCGATAGHVRALRRALAERLAEG